MRPKTQGTGVQRALSVFIGLVVLLTSNSLFVRAQNDDSQDLGSVLAGRKELSTYCSLIKKYPNILLQLPNFAGVTIIAPSNAAFDNIKGTALNNIWDPDNPEVVTSILLYHIIQGTLAVGAIPVGPPVFPSTLLEDTAWTNVTGGQHVIINKQPGDVVVFVSGQGTRATMIQGDIQFSGGLIHIIDNLLIPPDALNDTLTAFQDLPFLGALYTADIYAHVSSQPNCTIFAPSTLAFEAVNQTLDSLTVEALASILDYHIIPRQVLPSTSLLNGINLTSDLDSDSQVHIRRSGNNLYINSAQVVQPDILLANGILHIIDNVLNPAAADATPNVEWPAQPPVFASAIDTATLTETRLPFTTALPCSVSCPVTASVGSENGTASASASTASTGTSTLGDIWTSSSRAGTGGPRCTGLGVRLRVVAAGVGAWVLA